MLLHVLLLVLYPLSPALRIYEFVRWFLAQVLLGFEDPDYVAELEQDPEELAKLDRWLSIMEKFLHAIIGRLAAEQLGLSFRKRRPSLGRMPEARTAKPLTFEQVFSRFERITFMLADVEKLAIRRARRIGRELNADPLRLATSSLATSPAFAVEDSCGGRCVLHLSTDRGRWQPRSCAADGGGWRIRAPP